MQYGFNELNTAAAKAINSKIVSCLAIEVIKEEQPVLSFYRGTASFDDPKAIDDSVYFDLASVTKALATTTLAAMFIEKNMLSLDAKIGDIYEEYALSFNPALHDITIGNLLSHCAGFEAWIELYSIVKSKSDAYMFLRSRAPSYAPGSKNIYSDPGFILLGEIIELVSGKKLDFLFDSMVAGPLQLYNLKFLPVSKKDETVLDGVVCTGFSSVRQRMMIGEVNDENSYMMGGVSGHAGLFGTAKDVTRLASVLLGIFNGAPSVPPILRQDTVKKIWERSRDGSDWAYGWHYPTPGGKSTAGEFISPLAIGMTGFTGCSLWIDLQKQIIITILGNRTISEDSARKGGERDRFSELRPALHDKILGVL